MTAVLEATGLRKIFRGGDGTPIEVLAGVDLAVERGEFVAVVGASGAGKSTMLHILGGLEAPTEGQVRLDGQAYDALDDVALAALRNRKLGFVFQFHHLLRDFTALENVMLPLLIGGTSDAAATTRARELLDAVGMLPRQSHRPAALSGGEQQRVAVARALATDPLAVLADEPSGNLDTHNSERLHELFATLARRFETAVVVVTHNRSLAARADRVLQMDGGKLRALSGAEAMP